MVIGRMSIAFEIDGKLKLLAIPKDQERKALLLAVMQGALDGKLLCRDAPEDFKFMEVE